MFQLNDKVVNLMHSCNRKFCTGVITEITKIDFEITYDTKDELGNYTQRYSRMCFEYMEILEG